MNNLGPINYYLNIKITKNQINKIFILGQTAYINKILENLNIINSHAVKMLMNLNYKLKLNPLKYDAIPKF